MYLFGGVTAGGKDNLDMYSLDLSKFLWQLVKPKPAFGKVTNLPGPRDEHTACVFEDNMIVFGGFSSGIRTNDVHIYNFKDNEWTKMKIKSKTAPCPRSGHSAVIYEDEVYGETMYIFGGKDHKNIKLSDLWKLNLGSMKW
jgi:N-acetylneuraminic acid mutarotase